MKKAKNRKGRLRKSDKRPPPPPRNPEPPLPPPPSQPPHRRSIWRLIEIFAAIAGLIVFGYFLFEIFHQTSHPEIEVASFENGSPFRLPFSVKTPSLVFAMHNPKVTCSFDLHMVGNNIFTDAVSKDGTTLAAIDRGSPGNFFCRNEVPAQLVQSLRLRVSVEYCTRVFGYCWEREPEPTRFVWIPTRGGVVGYWLKGLLAK